MSFSLSSYLLPIFILLSLVWAFFKKIDLYDGFASGVNGAIGLVLGIVIVLIQQYFGVITLPSETFVIESYPVRLQLIDIIMVFTTFVVIAWGASQIAANSMIKKQL